jgi:hypothetical protein
MSEHRLTINFVGAPQESIAAFKGVTAGDLADGDDSLPSDEGKDASPAPGAEQEQQQQQQQQPNTSSQGGESAGGAQKQEGEYLMATRPRLQIRDCFEYPAVL